MTDSVPVTTSRTDPLKIALKAITMVTAMSWGLVGSSLAQVAGATTTLGLNVTESGPTRTCRP
jgi:hypothetical protein